MCVVLPKQLEDTGAHIPSVVSVLGRVRGVDGWRERKEKGPDRKRGVRERRVVPGI